MVLFLQYHVSQKSRGMCAQNIDKGYWKQALTDGANNSQTHHMKEAAHPTPDDAQELDGLTRLSNPFAINYASWQYLSPCRWLPTAHVTGLYPTQPPPKRPSRLPRGPIWEADHSNTVKTRYNDINFSALSNDTPRYRSIEDHVQV
jgi:hypothetical protein